MTTYKGIKGLGIQNVTTDAVASQVAGGSWSSGGNLNSGRAGSGGFGGGGSGSSGGGFGNLFGQQSDKPGIKYECLVCHKVYNARECPRCGSTMKRAMF